MYGRGIEVEVNGMWEMWPVRDIARACGVDETDAVKALERERIVGELATRKGRKALAMLREYAGKIGLEIGSDVMTVFGMCGVKALLYDGDVFVGEIDADSFDAFLGDIHRVILENEER
jgi:hypothetical protein|nr:MAG TPA: hypothetical protein [Caudoviricetes sp.]